MPNTDAELKIGFNLDQALEDIGSLKSALADAFKKIDGKGFTKLEGRISATTKDVENLDERLSSASANVTTLADKLKELDTEKQATLGKIADEERGLRALQKTWNEKYERAPESNGATKNLEAQAAQNRLIKENKEYVVLIEQEQAKLQAEYDKATASANEVLTAYTQQKDTVSQIVEDVEVSVQNQQEFSREIKATSENTGNLRENLDGAATASQSFAQSVKDMAATSTDNPLNSLPQETDEATKKLTELENTLNNVVATTDRISEAMNTEPATNNIAELIRRLNELNVAKKTLEELNLPAGTDATYNKIIQLIAVLNGQVSSYKKQLTGVAEKHEKTKKSGTDFAKSVLSGVKSLKSAMSKLDRVGNKVKSSFNSMAHSMKSNFKHLITSITKYVLGFRSLFFLVRRLRKYLGEGIQNLAQFNDGNNLVNESITDMLSSLLFLKNAWAAAFSPIITYVRPILVKLIDDLAEVGNAVARFMSALLGQEIAFNAVRVRAQDYADSLDNVGGSAGSAADKTKKLTDRLAAFDDLNVLGIDKDPDDTGSGGGGGLADQYIPDPNEMFKIVDPEENGFLKMLKDAWENADFSIVGSTIKDKIIGVLQGIDWGSVQGTGIKIGSSFGSFIAGLFGDPELFTEAGKTIAGGLNTVTGAIDAFLDEVEGVDFGGNLAEGFNTFLKTTDWQTAGANISRTFSMITTNINSFLDTINDEELEKSIHEFIMGLDIPKMLYDAGKTTIKLLGKLTIISVDIIKALGESLGDNLILYAQTKVRVTQVTQTGYDENGNLIEMPVYIEPEYDWTEHPFKALIDKILMDIGSVGVEVLFHFDDEDEFDQFTEDWLKIFGEDGNFFKTMDVISSFIQGNPGKLITAIFGENEDLETLRTTLDGILSILRPGDVFAFADMFRDVDLGKEFEDMKNNWDWGDFWSGSSHQDADGDGKISEIEAGWDQLSTASEKTYNKVKGNFQLLDTDLSVIWDNLKLTAETTATTLYDTLSTKWDEIKGNAYEKFVGVKTNITDKLQEAKDSAEEKVALLKTTLTDKWQEIKGAIYEKLVGIKLNVVTVFEQLKDAVKGPINGFIDIVENMVNKVIDGINWLADELNSLPDVQFSWMGKDYELGFSIPTLGQITIPHLAQGAVIPPNREFMAVLGDQSHGTNIEAPLDTIKQAVAEVLANNGNAEMIQLLQQLITVVENKNLVIGDKDIGRANARYVKQQNIVRGSTF